MRSDDTILLQRCRDGEREAYGLLINRYRDRVVNLAYSLSASHEDAEDIAQEAFTKAFSNLHSYRGESQFWTWIYRITINICLQRRRSAKVHLSLEDEDSAHEGSTESHIIEKLHVRCILNQVSPTLRVVLILREMHELSYEEIARVLEIPVGTVRSRLNEARHRFKIAWNQEANQ
jgi:RNA polymerase sigma-70 factor (ECF subfamily)